MDDYVDSRLLPVLEAAGLDTFDALWALQADWFEPPNQRRGGWSGVARIELSDAQGVVRGLFLKRQQNHTRQTLAHPIGGEPTFAAEMRNILGLQAAGVPTLEPVFYAQRRIDGQWCVVLMTRELRDFRPLKDYVDEWRSGGWQQARAQRRQVLAATAPLIRRMHRAGFVHNALHPKHVFLRVIAAETVEVRLIDLEKTRRRFLVWRNALRDLDSLNRRSVHWSASDRLRFLKLYLGTVRLDWGGRLLWRLLARRYAAKVPIGHGTDG